MHVLGQESEFRPVDRPVLAQARGVWRDGRITAWHRTSRGWIAQVIWRTGPPIFSYSVDFLPATEVINAEACLICVVASSRWRRHLTSASPVE